MSLDEGPFRLNRIIGEPITISGEYDDTRDLVNVGDVLVLDAITESGEVAERMAVITSVETRTETNAAGEPITVYQVTIERAQQ